MTQQPIRFDDGAAYEHMMGAWSRLVGHVFLDWLSPATGQRWIDVGCGNGAFTEQLIQRCAPAEARGIDPSEGQLAFARTRPGAIDADQDPPLDDSRGDISAARACLAGPHAHNDGFDRSPWPSRAGCASGQRTLAAPGSAGATSLSPPFQRRSWAG
jgi:SAM-dependent methyltransferase